MQQLVCQFAESSLPAVGMQNQVGRFPYLIPGVCNSNA